MFLSQVSSDDASSACSLPCLNLVPLACSLPRNHNAEEPATSYLVVFSFLEDTYWNLRPLAFSTTRPDPVGRSFRIWRLLLFPFFTSLSAGYANRLPPDPHEKLCSQLPGSRVRSSFSYRHKNFGNAFCLSFSSRNQLERLKQCTLCLNSGCCGGSYHYTNSS